MTLHEAHPFLHLRLTLRKNSVWLHLVNSTFWKRLWISDARSIVHCQFVIVARSISGSDVRARLLAWHHFGRVTNNSAPSTSLAFTLLFLLTSILSCHLRLWWADKYLLDSMAIHVSKIGRAGSIIVWKLWIYSVRKIDRQAACALIVRVWMFWYVWNGPSATYRWSTSFLCLLIWLVYRIVWVWRELRELRWRVPSSCFLLSVVVSEQSLERRVTSLCLRTSLWSYIFSWQLSLIKSVRCQILISWVRRQLVQVTVVIWLCVNRV